MKLPMLQPQDLKKGLGIDTLLGVRSLPGFPSLHRIPHVSELREHGISTFGRECR